MGGLQSALWKGPSRFVEVDRVTSAPMVLYDKANPSDPSERYKFRDLRGTQIEKSVASHGRGLIKQEQDRRGLAQLAPQIIIMNSVENLTRDQNVVRAVMDSVHFRTIVQTVPALMALGDETTLRIFNEDNGNVTGAPPEYSNEGSSSSEGSSGLGQLVLGLAAFGLCPTCGTPAVSGEVHRESSGTSVDTLGNEGAAPQFEETPHNPFRTNFVAKVLPLVVLLIVCSLMIDWGLVRTARAIFSHCFRVFWQRLRMP